MSSGVSALPRFVGLQSPTSNRYLRFADEDGEYHGFLLVNGEELVSPTTKFEFQRSQNGGNFVHIRSTFNNKYLVRSSPTVHWIVTTDEPEEDRTKWSCTLFEPAPGGLNGSYRFQHVQSRQYIVSNQGVIGRPEQLYLATVGVSSGIGLSIIDLDSYVQLPRHVTFKGYNDLYLSSRVIERFNYHQFASDDKYDPTIRFEAVVTPNGSIRIWSNHFGRFWRRSPNWIWGDSADTTTQNPDTLFWPINLQGNVIALRNLGNNNICKALTAERKTNCLNAQISNIDQFGRLQMEEVVSMRQIYDVTYRTEDARIYNFSNGNSLTREVNNRLSNPQKETLSFNFTRTVTNTWDVAHGWSTSVETTINAGIPFFAAGQISIGVSYSGELSWGETKEESFETSASLSLEVPPNTTAFVTRIVTRGAIDIPFSYTQEDTLLSGRVVTQRFHDGIFTGENTYVDFTTREEPL